MSLHRALVLVNVRASGGEAARKWNRVRPIVERTFDAIVIEFDAAGLWRRAVCDELVQGVTTFIAAGGDGTVHALLNAIVGLRGEHPLCDLTLGAIGLGSSNDFHKPFHSVEEGVPLAIDLGARRLRDVCTARLSSSEGAATDAARAFIVSASLGVTANANVAFNRGGAVQSWLKRRSTPAAILYAAVRTIQSHRNVSVRLLLDGLTHRAELSNLSILKTPFVGGSFRFDVPVAPDDGRLSVNLCEGMSRAETLRTLYALSHGRFLGRPKCRHWHVASLTVEVGAPVAVELDGEVFSASRVEFGVLEERIGVCG